VGAVVWFAPRSPKPLLDRELLAMLPVWYAVFLLSVTCHEAAHALAALRGGDRTAYLGGQVSLNPLPHVLREPIGTIVVPLLTFLQMGWMMGWASAPYDPLWEARHPRRAAFMAASGPLANLLLEELADPQTPEDITFGFYGEVEELIQALKNERPPRPSIEEIFPSVRACFELALQAESGA